MTLLTSRAFCRSISSCWLSSSRHFSISLFISLSRSAITLWWRCSIKFCINTWLATLDIKTYFYIHINLTVWKERNCLTCLRGETGMDILTSIVVHHIQTGLLACVSPYNTSLCVSPHNTGLYLTPQYWPMSHPTILAYISPHNTGLCLSLTILA